jgi:NADPH:quinone reductase-like Zn-dependent oxidoreductase
MRERSIPAALMLFREIASMIRKGVLSSEIGQVYNLEEVGEAAQQADSVARHGKVLVRL